MTQRPHPVNSGVLVTAAMTAFKGVEKSDVVSIIDDEEAAYHASRNAAQRTVDRVQVRYFTVLQHRSAASVSFAANTGAEG